MARDYWLEPARVRRVIDGDTVELLLDTGFRQRLVQTVRLDGVDTAEIYGTPKESEEYQTGMDQTYFVEDWLDVSSGEEYPLTVETVGEGKYSGRWVGDIQKNGHWEGTAYVEGDRLTDALLDKWPEVSKEY